MCPINYLGGQSVRILLAASFFCLLHFQAQSQRDLTVQPDKNGKRIALVLGNAAYQSQTPLTNTLKDADSMALALRACGFEVLLYKNANLEQMDCCITDLNNKLRQSKYEAAVFYYSGHGLQVEGDNYLVPVDARLSEIYDVKYLTLSAQRILDMMEASKVPTKILLLDACRDNPFSKRWKSVDSEYEQGLAAMSAPDGTFIGFAASPGKQSSDGGMLGNGVYTKAILKHIRTPGLTIDELFTRVAASTRELIGKISGVQIPFKNSSLSANFYFLPPKIGVKNEVADRDGDGVLDKVDVCPDRVGPASNGGCPVLTDTGKKEKAELTTDVYAGTFVLVKGGTFKMGFESGQAMHNATLSDYYIGETEITQAQWEELMGKEKWPHENCDNCPVDNVSWEGIQRFIIRLNIRCGGTYYRLPTEAEWEFAARGGRQSKAYTYAGSNNIDTVAWYHGNSGGKTHPVKGKMPNELGLYDMSGNVREWCSDWYGPYSSEAQTNPTGAVTGVNHVDRGGSWYNLSYNCTVARRVLSKEKRQNGSKRPDGYGLMGFRLARDVTN